VKSQTLNLLKTGADSLTTPTNFRRTLVTGGLAMTALSVGGSLGSVRVGELHSRMEVLACTAAFIVFGVIAVLSAVGELSRVVAARGGDSAASIVRITATIAGYVIIGIATLGLLDVPLGHLLVGGALTGVVLGIAAQQTLGNVFAGLVLLMSRPFVVGDEIRVRSGALGGQFHGMVAGMGLTYVTLMTDDGELHVPNSGVLAAAVGPYAKSV
jgi:small-conductance mechanosensitive channel